MIPEGLKYKPEGQGEGDVVPLKSDAPITDSIPHVNVEVAE